MEEGAVGVAKFDVIDGAQTRAEVAKIDSEGNALVSFELSG